MPDFFGNRVSVLNRSVSFRSMPSWRIASAAVVSLFILGSTVSVHAQTSKTQAPSITRASNEIKYTLGLGATYGAKYMGSDDYELKALPFIAFQYGRFFLDPERGLGAEFSTDSGFFADVALQVDRGRDDEDDLRGMGRVRSSTTVGLSVSQALTQWLVVDAGASMRVAGQKGRGHQYQLGLTLIPYETDTDVLTISGGAQFGSREYNQTYFGVNSEQAARTRYREFQAERGVNAYSLDIGWSHMFDRHWALDAGVGLTKISSKMQDSPIVADDTNYSVIAGISYNF